MRLFAAIRPPTDALTELGAVVDELAAFRAGARLAERALWHVTVAFLGDVPEARVPDASAALDAAVRGAAPMRLRITGGGRFGRGAFAVLWAGVAGSDEDATGAFADLASDVRRQLRRARLPYDDRPLRPHLTLARPGTRISPAELAGDIERLHTFTGAPFPVEALLLFRSELGPHPAHHLVSTHPLPH